MILWLIPALILIFPIELIDFPPPPFVSSTAAVPRAPSQPGKAQLELRPVPQLDRKSFLQSFERQAAKSLIACLRSEAGETGSISFLARLKKSGELRAIRIVEPRLKGLVCALSAVEEMRFTGIGTTSDDLEIGWRFDW